MDKNGIYKDAVRLIEREEATFSLKSPNLIEESYRMVSFLRNLLFDLKKHVLKHGFTDVPEEILFFKEIKPKILSKLIFYNKVGRIEMSCPLSKGNLYDSYYSNQIQIQKAEYNDHAESSEFYKYYRAGRVDRDETYFRLGNINYYDGLNSFVFEIDIHFSTYYDFKIAKILADDLLSAYLLLKKEGDFKETADTDLLLESDEIYWSASKKALTELLYALHVTGCISHSKISLKRLSIFFQVFLKVDLGDIHHSFHRMKNRSGDRSTFLTHLKNSIEQYMDKDL